jgi:hypothetical protein
MCLGRNHGPIAPSRAFAKNLGEVGKGSAANAAGGWGFPALILTYHLSVVDPVSPTSSHPLNAANRHDSYVVFSARDSWWLPRGLPHSFNLASTHHQRCFLSFSQSWLPVGSDKLSCHFRVRSFNTPIYYKLRDGSSLRGASSGHSRLLHRLATCHHDPKCPKLVTTSVQLDTTCRLGHRSLSYRRYYGLRERRGQTLSLSQTVS